MLTPLLFVCAEFPDPLCLQTTVQCLMDECLELAQKQLDDVARGMVAEGDVGDVNSLTILIPALIELIRTATDPMKALSMRALVNYARVGAEMQNALVTFGAAHLAVTCLASPLDELVFEACSLLEVITQRPQYRKVGP